MTDGQKANNGRVTVAVLGSQLKEIDRKLDSIVADHDILIRMQVRVEHNQKDIDRLGRKTRDLDKVRRREATIEMLAAALIGIGAWLRP